GTLEHVGVFARRIDDVGLLREELSAHDERDPDTRPRPRVPYRAVSAGEPPLAPLFAFVKSSLWDRVDADAREAFEELVATLGDRVEEVELVTPTEEVLEWQRAIGGAEISIHPRHEWGTGRAKPSPPPRAPIPPGPAGRPLGHLRALAPASPPPARPPRN